jgi:hypothetical protein
MWPVSGIRVTLPEHLLVFENTDFVEVDCQRCGTIVARFSLRVRARRKSSKRPGSTDARIWVAVNRQWKQGSPRDESLHRPRSVYWCRG